MTERTSHRKTGVCAEGWGQGGKVTGWGDKSSAAHSAVGERDTMVVPQQKELLLSRMGEAACWRWCFCLLLSPLRLPARPVAVP